MQAVATTQSPQRAAMPISRDKDSRDNLLLMATSRFCSSSTYDRISISQYKEAFYLLIEDVDDSTKRKIAQYISSCEYTPRQIALYLALEPLEISMPVISQSPTLGQLDLLRIIDMKGSDFARIIASRPDIGPGITKHLRQIDCPSVQEALQNNYALQDHDEGHNTSRFTASADSFVTHLSDSGEEINLHSSDKKFSTAETRLLDAAARGRRIALNSDREAAQPRIEEKTNLGDVIEQAAQKGEHQSIAQILHQEVGLTLQVAHQVLRDQSGNTLSVLLSAQNVSASQTSRILMLSNPNIGLSVENARSAIAFFDKLNPETSREAVAKWPKDKSQAIKHESILSDTDRSRADRTTATYQQATQHIKLDRQTG